MKLKSIKVAGLAVGPLALLIGCGVIVVDSQTDGCVGFMPLATQCPPSSYSMDGGQCVSTYYTYVPYGAASVDNYGSKVCYQDTTVQSSLLPCQGDSSTPPAASGISPALPAFLRRLLPRAASGFPYPANQMQTFRATSSGSMPFDLAAAVLNLPFQPLVPGATTYTPADANCDSTVSVLTVGYSRGTVLLTNPCNLTVGSPIQTGTGSLEIALTPDGKFAFVTNFNGSIAVIDTNALTIVSTIPTPGANPFGIAMSPDGTTAWVASYNATSPALLVINVAARTLATTVPLSVIPQNVFVSPDGTLLWITSQQANNITILDTLTLTPSATITAVSLPTGIAFNPTGTVAYVASATIPGTVQAVSTQNYSILTSYAVGNEPVDVRMSDSTWIKVMNRSSDFLSNINVISGQVTTESANLVPNVPHTGLAFVQ